MKKILSLILCISLVLVPSISCFAEETGEIKSRIIETRINPLYEDVIDIENIEKISERVFGNDSKVAASVSSEEYSDTIEEAGDSLRQQMEERKTTAIVYYVNDYGYNEQIFKDIFNEAVLRHTGEPTEGDYLNWHWKTCGGRVSYYESNGKTYITFTYNLSYYTTAAQEAELDTAVANLRESLDLEGKNQYEKVCIIYDYMCDNITYDYDGLEAGEDIIYTAYAALIEKSAVCQGYANLFYRLALEEGIDARVITGTSFGENHGWNIVQMNDNYYYNLDSTWDAGQTNYSYFLKSPDNFKNHARSEEYTTAAFNAAYPMGTSDYVYNPGDFGGGLDDELGGAENIIASGYCGAEGDGKNLSWALSEDGTLTIRGTGAMADYSNEWSEETQKIVINRPWEEYKDQIKKLVLGEGITRIGSYSFGQLYNVECELVIPSTVKVIGNSAFWDSGFSGELVLPEGLEKLENCALINNGFTYVYIPSTLTEMEYRAFWNHWDLERFEVSESNPVFCDVDGVVFTKDKKELVYFPGGKTGEYSVPEGTEVIRENAFSTESLTSLHIPASIKLIKPGAFRFYCSDITVDGNNKVYEIRNNSLYSKVAMELIAYLGDNEEVYVVPEGTTKIYQGAFYYKKIGQVILPESLEKIENSAFSHFSGDVFVEGRIENVEQWAFSNNFNNINIFFVSGSPMKIGENAFGSSEKIKLYYLHGTEYLWNFDENGLWNGYEVLPFIFEEGPEFDPEDYVASGYCGAELLGKNLVWLLDEEGTLTIRGTGAMADYEQVFVNEGMYSSAPWGLLVDDIKEIVIEDGVTHIGDSAFYGWTTVKDVTIPASVKSIGNLGFYGKSANFYIEGQLEFVETVAFGSTNKRTNIYFTNGAPLDCEANAFGEGNTISNLFYFSGTEDKWTFDENGLWNGYKVTKCNVNGFVIGDLNKDGKVDVKDVYMARLFAAKLFVPTDEEIELGDVNGDGKINVIDANLIRKFALGIITKFSA